MIDFLSVIKDNAVALAESVREVGLDSPVPTCPEWTAADLCSHIMGVHSWVETMVRTGAMERLDRATLPPGPSRDDGLDAVVIGVQERAGALIRTLSNAKPDEPVWNWSLNQPKVAGFWPRRMGQETVIHRVDADACRGVVPDVPADVAVDGIDELVSVFLPARASYMGNVALGGSLLIACTDSDDAWTVSCEGKVCDVTRGGSDDAAASVRGPASALLLWLWNRVPLDAEGIERSGDAKVVEAWRTFAV